MRVNILLYIVIEVVGATNILNADWDRWWHYRVKSVGGPLHWGRNTSMPGAWESWKLCQIGKMQSPISINPHFLVFDQNLPPLQIIENGMKQLELEAYNTGQDIQFSVTKGSVLINDGPLSYQYKIEKVLLKFGYSSSKGSDHHIRNLSYPGEIQVFGFNSDLYSSYEEAQSKSHGLIGIGVFFKLDKSSNTDFSALVAASDVVQSKGQSFPVKGIKIEMLLPSLKEYITYEGSLPHPPCHESVTWIVLNEPISVTETQLKTLRNLRSSTNKQSKAMYDNYRPLQKVNSRSIRTNINVRSTEKACEIQKSFTYSSNYP